MRKRHPPWVVLAMRALSLESRLDLAALHHLTNLHNHREQPQAGGFLTDVPTLGLVSHDLCFHVYMLLFVIGL